MNLLSVLIPAHNEADEITACLASVFASRALPQGWQGEVLVIANGCTDQTASLARAAAVPPGWRLQVLDLPEGGKLAALNAGDRTAQGAVLAYLDADVRLEPGLLAQTVEALRGSAARYASGRPQLMPAVSGFSRAYGRVWMTLPFLTRGVPGFGYFAINRAGRNRWQNWPDIIADDMFARLSFAPSERHLLPGAYFWPLAEGLSNLIRVRRRQDAGNRELAHLFPALLPNEDPAFPAGPALRRAALCDPAGLAAYALVKLAIRLPTRGSAPRWARGR